MPNRLRSRSTPDWIPRRLLALVLILSSVLVFLPAAAQQQPPQGTQATAQTVDDPELEQDKNPSADVIIDGRSILTVYQPIGGYSPKDRADKIAQRVVLAAEDPQILPESVALEPRDAWTEITADSRVLMVVTEADAKTAGKPRKQLATDYAGNIRQAILMYRREHSWNAILRAILYTVLTTGIFFLITWGIRKLRLAVRARMEAWVTTRTNAAEKKTPLHVAITYALSLGLALGSAARWLVLLAILEIYATVVLSFYPGSRHISHAVTDWILATLGQLGRTALDYIPNLFVIAVVVAIATQVIKLISLVFSEVGKGNLALSGFYPEWAEPTSKLVRILVFILVVVIIFPYLPGSKSHAFQGISIFVGLLLSLGSSSAVANGIAGIILTYMRSYMVGDWVKIGDTLGEVVERNMLVTRIVTQKKEIITIPNASVMNGAVINYTREAQHRGVIFHTTVTIGYDAPWKTVHQLLISAALATDNILQEPAPFVLQTALNDFYVAYELNVFTNVPTIMQFIYSDLHQNIQDSFNEAGVEICSPHFSSLRDGNTIAIPERYRPPDYTPPAFRVDGSRKEEEATAVKAR